MVSLNSVPLNAHLSNVLQILYVLHQDVLYRNHYIPSLWGSQLLVFRPIASEGSLITGRQTILPSSNMAQTFEILVHVILDDRSCFP